jgi:peptidyl-prolyl cis-trans isomerase SurA
MHKSAIFSLIFFVFSLLASVCGATIVDKVIAIVNGEIITLSELERFRSEVRDRPTGTANPREERDEELQLKREILDHLIREKLVDQQCKKMAIAVSERDIDMAIEDVKRANSFTDEQLKMALMAERLSWKDFREQLREEVKRAKLLSRVVRGEINPEEDRLRDYYLKNIERFKEPDKIRASHILIATPQDADDLLVEALRYKGEMILERLHRGEDFGKLAQLCSNDVTAKNGGDLGYFKRGELIPEFERVTVNLEPGQISGLVRTKVGFHIIKVTEKKEGSVTPYEDVKNKVRNQYLEEESKRLFEDWLKKVREESFIEVRL